MNCAACGFDVQSGFAYCARCGAKQPSICVGCGYPCPPDFLFCPRCGVKVGSSRPEPHQNAATPAMPAARPVDTLPASTGRRGEQPASLPHGDAEADRRTVTVLFADLSGFTALSERLDPEELRVLQNDLFAELTAAVHAFDGFVDKFIGDALLALFGAPVAHEDDPERALRAALDMLGRAARIAGRSAAYAGEPLLLHIGINTGPVVTGGFGSGNAKSYSVTGDTVNTAQRLQSLAAPGESWSAPSPTA